MNTFNTLPFLPLGLLSLYILVRLVQWGIRIHQFRRTMPVIPLLVPPRSVIRKLIIPISWQRYHFDWFFHSKGHEYRALQSDVFAMVCLFEYDTVCVRSAEAFCEMKITDLERFPKDQAQFKMAAIYGENVVTADGKEWRHHRKVTSKAFAPKNVQLVFSETARQTRQMLGEWDAQTEDIVVEDVHHQSMKLALHVIYAAAYGYEFDWDSTDEIWTGHQMGIKASIRLLIDELRMFVILPTPLLKILPFEYSRKVVQSYDETKQYFRELIQLEKSGGTTNTAGRTVLSSLVEKSADGIASEKGDTLTETEILGNIFFFLLAGHETTANVIMYALYLMALHPSVQDTFHEELARVCGSNEPTFQNVSSDLIYALCITYETMRLFPFVGSLPHLVQADQLLLGKYMIPRGTNMALDWVNVQRHEKYWGPTANEFDPSRFFEKDEKGGRLKVLPKGYFIGFSEGPRACLGRRFAEVEIMTHLAMIVQKYTVHLKEGWTREQVWDGLNSSVQTTTIRLRSPIPLVFKKR